MRQEKSKAMITVAVDFMSDCPENVIAGANEAFCYSSGEKIVVVGPKDIESKLKYGTQLQEAGDFFGMGEGIESLRTKPGASISVACKMVKENKAQAMVSAGNSAATVAAAVSILGRVNHIERPAIALVVPVKGGKAVLADVGAVVDAKPEWMLDWAVLSSIYASALFGKSFPLVGLLNIGEERGKGNDLTKACYSLFEKCTRINFVGNVEDVFAGLADVVICDGFAGNVVLKSLEGGLRFFGGEGLKEADYALYGGALLLGVKGTVVIAHGKSSPKAIENAIGVAVEAAKKKVVRQIAEISNKKISQARR